MQSVACEMRQRPQTASQNFYLVVFALLVIGSNSRAASQGFHLRTAHPLGFLAPGHE